MKLLPVGRQGTASEKREMMFREKTVGRPQGRAPTASTSFRSRSNSSSPVLGIITVLRRPWASSVMQTDRGHSRETR